MPEKKPYRRIRGSRGASLASYHSLWAGDDHLLSVTNTYGNESYKKYYFAEIQALVSHRTSGWTAANITLGALAAFFLLPAIVLYWNGTTDTAIALTVFAGILLIIFFINLLAGPTAKLCIQTATSYDRLAGVARQRKARKVIAQIAPLVHQAQQGLLSQPATPSEAGAPASAAIDEPAPTA